MVEHGETNETSPPFYISQTVKNQFGWLHPSFSCIPIASPVCRRWQNRPDCFFNTQGPSWTVPCVPSAGFYEPKGPAIMDDVSINSPSESSNHYKHYLLGLVKTHYPLVNVYITMENHHFQWVNPLQMTIFNSYFDITRGYSIWFPMFWGINWRNIHQSQLLGYHPGSVDLTQVLSLPDFADICRRTRLMVNGVYDITAIIW